MEYGKSPVEVMVIFRKRNTMEKKLISIVIPTYNEEENVVLIYEAIMKMWKESLNNYAYEIIFIDNYSTDHTRDLIKRICASDKGVKAIFNTRNFGAFNSPFYGLCQTSGECSVLLCADFQDPIDMIPKFIKEWEAGWKIVCGVKTNSGENKIIYAIRSVYYKMMKKMSDTDWIEQFTGFGLYDKLVIEKLRELKDPIPFLRGIIAELGYTRKELSYTQPKRKYGHSKFNFYRNYDAAMLSFTSYTKVGLRVATFFGFISSVSSILVALIYLVFKLIFWNSFAAGTIPILLGVFVLGSLQLFFIGLLGEYILSINTRLMNRPLVIEEERINF